MGIDKLIKYRKWNHKKSKATYIKITASALLLCLLAVGAAAFVTEGEKQPVFYRIWVNGREVGALWDKARGEELLWEARRNVALEREGLVFMEPSVEILEEERRWEKPDREQDVLRRMEDALRAEILEERSPVWVLKVRDRLVYLSSQEEVRDLLQAAVDKYGGGGDFVVELVQDPCRGPMVLGAEVVDGTSQDTEEMLPCMGAGIQGFFAGLRRDLQETSGKLKGIRQMEFSQEIKVAQAWLPQDQVMDFSQALSLLLQEEETEGIYVVQEGDVLSEIALRLDIPMERIVALNDSLENENTTLHIGDRLVVSLPEPELSVTWVEVECYEETYEADVVYVDNDSWYTNKSQVARQPSAGVRKVVAEVRYQNDREVSREILQEEVVVEAVAKVVERGTRVPPSYVRPVTGGRLSSGFGSRNAPVKGASTNHKGVDWAVPSGTGVYASCGGRVSKAGWGSGYGYVIYIEHEDGRQTRYGHLSKVLVKTGQEVRQGDRIALSGSTGNVSGPHLHFEILVNGSQVNPLKYLE